MGFDANVLISDKKRWMHRREAEWRPSAPSIAAMATMLLVRGNFSYCTRQTRASLQFEREHEIANS